MQTQVQNEWIKNTIELAKLYGILKYLPNGQFTHAPFSISPYKISGTDLHEMTELTAKFSELMISISRNWDFLEEHLEPIAKIDPFLQMLMDFRTDEITQNKQFLVQRNDFFLVKDEYKKLGQSGDLTDRKITKSALRQVELNTVSASFPFLITKISHLHDYLFEQNLLPEIIPNNPLNPLVDSFAKVVRDYGSPEGVMLLISQSEEGNIFDQLGLEQLLWDEHKITTVRKTLAKVFEGGCLRQGHLVLEGKIVALCYYRAGFTPADFRTIEAVKGRQLIEASSTIQVPDLQMQLAGMKKIQQVLTRPEILFNFTSAKTSKNLFKTFVQMHTLDEIIETPKGEMLAKEWVSGNPENYVLKPQREGGGNNFFGPEIPKILKTIRTDEQNAYILMEKIPAQTQSAVLVVNGHAEELTCISEVGRYGICYADNGVLEVNQDAGYLVRTKAENINEGGVCAGFACLNSLTMEV